MFIDKAKIYIKAGNGGDGIVSFLRLKGFPNGGPDGGDGGDGGSIIFKADSSINNLSDFYYKTRFKASDGLRGENKNCTGKSAPDLIINVPLGTVIRDEATGNIIADMFYDGETKTVLQGGRGGKGNSKFCTSTRRSPAFSQKGEITDGADVILELKTIADVGLCGFPNVGKSTLLSVISAARPKIADYHFTTLHPNLGIVRYGEQSFLAADIPGLIEGASQGKGLGHEFLRHIERVRVLIHVLDMSGNEGRDPYDDFMAINKELTEYNKNLGKIPQIIAANKMDLHNSKDNLAAFKKRVKKFEIIPISAITTDGTIELIKKALELLQNAPKLVPLEFVPYVYEPKDKTEFEIIKEKDGVFIVTGGLVDMLAKNVTIDDYDSFNYFQKKLRDTKVILKLKELGCKTGDTVVLKDFEFEFIE